MSDCVPSDLIDSAWTKLTPQQRQVVKTQMLYEWTETDHQINELSQAAACYHCLSPQQRKAIQVELLCQILG